MKNAPKLIAYTALAVALTVGFVVTTHAQDRALVNVIYDPTRELYQQFNEAFVAHWQAEKGETVSIENTHGGSGALAPASAARALRPGVKCFVGIGRPSAAANLARRTNAPDLVLIYESGTIDTRPDQLPLSIGDGVLVDSALSVVSVPEIFNYWLQPGRIDVGFLSGAQLDRFGNINTTVIGDYHQPKVRLPGAGGAPEIAGSAKQVLIILKQSHRTFVDKLAFVRPAGASWPLWNGRSLPFRIGWHWVAWSLPVLFWRTCLTPMAYSTWAPVLRVLTFIHSRCLPLLLPRCFCRKR